MTNNSILEEIKTYTKAYQLFSEGKTQVEKKHFGEAVDRLRESVNLIGMDGIRMMEHTHKIPVDYYTFADFHEQMGKAYFGLEKYENAEEHLRRWMEEVKHKHGEDSKEMAECHRWMALLWKKKDAYWNEVVKNMPLDTRADCWPFVKAAADIEAREEYNRKQILYHFHQAYDILKAKDSAAVEINNLKSDIVEYFCNSVANIQLMETLKLSLLFIPFAIVILVAWGFAWKSLAVFVGFLVVFIIWRFVNFIILEVLTYYHHQKTIF